MIALGCDHGGLALKNAVKQYLEENQIPYRDFGTMTEDSIDYAPVAVQVARSVAGGESEKGILCCGTGIGMSIAANKVKGIRASVCTDAFCAEMTRRHNDANMMAIGAGVTGEMLALEIVDTWLDTEFSHAERHQRRIDKMMALENE